MLRPLFLASPFRFLPRHLCSSLCVLAVCSLPCLAQAQNIRPVLTDTAVSQPTNSTLEERAARYSKSVMRGAITEDAKLLKVVALARHGVRSPVQPPQELALWSKKKWPVWPVAPGYLTPRGAELVSYLWSELREQLSAEGLAAAPDSGCPPVGSVYVHADNEERTRATATALLEGFAPGCGLSYVYVDDKGHLIPASTPATPTTDSKSVAAFFDSSRPDPLFHPVQAKVCTPSKSDAISMAAQINIREMEHTLRQQLNLMGKLLGKADDELCSRYRARTGCLAPLLPTRVIINGDGEAHLDGGLGIASSIAEIWLLEAAQWPTTNPAWNGLDTATLQHLLPIHAVPFNAVQRSATLARTQGSALLAAMVNALGTPDIPTPASSASLVVFVGHDTSIAHVASLLDLNWTTQSWPENSVPPGAVLLLSLWESNGQKLVSANFVTQPLSVMRSDNPQILSQTSPEWANPTLHGNIPTPGGPALPLPSLVSKLPTIVNPRCL